MISDKQIVCPNNLLDAASKRKGVSAAIVNAGNDTSICLGDSIILNGTFSGSATSVTWSTSGDGTFNNNILIIEVL